MISALHMPGTAPKGFGGCHHNDDDACHVVATPQFWILCVKAMSVWCISLQIAIKTMFRCHNFADLTLYTTTPAL